MTHTAPRAPRTPAKVDVIIPPLAVDGPNSHASWHDFDGDGTDELYVANDDNGEINRYVWVDREPQRELLYTHPEGLSGFTWNIMPAPVALIPAG